MITALVLTAALALTPAVTLTPAVAAPDDLTAVEVSFRTSDGLELGATPYAPRERGGPLPGMLLVHGSGTGGPGYREQLRGEAEAFARQGIAVLAPDKRELGYDRFHRDFSQLADDALAAFAVLRDRPEVGPAKAGIWGLIEGGWVAPLAASRSADVAFVVTAAAPGLCRCASRRGTCGTSWPGRGWRGR